MSDKNLRPEDLDRLGQALITVTKELSVVKDRVRVLEAALTEAGALAPGAVDTLQPDDTLQTELEQERKLLINSLLEALAPDENQK